MNSELRGRVSATLCNCEQTSRTDDCIFLGIAEKAEEQMRPSPHRPRVPPSGVAKNNCATFYTRVVHD